MSGDIAERQLATPMIMFWWPNRWTERLQPSEPLRTMPCDKPFEPRCDALMAAAPDCLVSWTCTLNGND
jgi:hypothetical protein